MFNGNKPAWILALVVLAVAFLVCHFVPTPHLNKMDANSHAAPR